MPDDNPDLSELMLLTPDGNAVSGPVQAVSIDWEPDPKGAPSAPPQAESYSFSAEIKLTSEEAAWWNAEMREWELLDRQKAVRPVFRRTSHIITIQKPYI